MWPTCSVGRNYNNIEHTNERFPFVKQLLFFFSRHDSEVYRQGAQAGLTSLCLDISAFSELTSIRPFQADSKIPPYAFTFLNGCDACPLLLQWSGKKHRLCFQCAVVAFRKGSLWRSENYSNLPWMFYILFAPVFLSRTLCTVLVAMIFSSIQLGRGRNATEPQPLQTRIELNGNVSAMLLFRSTEETHTSGGIQGWGRLNCSIRNRSLWDLHLNHSKYTQCRQKCRFITIMRVRQGNQPH